MANATTWQQGHRKRGGRVKGTPNKTTTLLKDAILLALQGVGGVAYLEQVARDHPQVFVTLLGRVLPLQVRQDGPDPRLPASVIDELHP